MSLRQVVAAFGALLLLVAACSEESPAVDYLETATTAATGGTLDPEAAIAAGASTFAGSCSACHGAEALGVDGLGKNLVGTDFVTGQSVEQLVAFITTGRPADDPENTTGIAMLPRGGNASLTDQDLANVALWLKSLAGDAPTAAPSEPAADPAAIEAGATLFAGSCSACHAADATGVPGLGKNLVGTDFIQGQSTGALVAFIKVGRPSDDPANTTGIAMLPKGGNPSLGDDDLTNIVSWLKSLG